MIRTLLIPLEEGNFVFAHFKKLVRAAARCGGYAIVREETLNQVPPAWAARTSSLNVLLLARTYADLLMSVRNKKSLSLAYVGDDYRLLGLTEALSDCTGFGSESFFAGKPTDTFRQSQLLSGLDVQSVDVAFLADSDPATENRLGRELRQLLSEGSSANTTRLLRLLKLADACESVARQCRPDCWISCLNPHKLAVISLAILLAPRTGAVIECGTYLGGTTIWMALLQRVLRIVRPLFALDTFEGMPAPIAQDGVTVYQQGLFSDNQFDRVEGYYRAQDVLSDIRMLKGLAQETLPQIWKHSEKVALAFLDMDQYAGTIAGLNAIVPRLQQDGLIIVDDTTVTGVDLAIRETLEAFPQLRRIPLRRNFDVLYASPGPGFLSESEV